LDPYQDVTDQEHRFIAKGRQNTVCVIKTILIQFEKCKPPGSASDFGRLDLDPGGQKLSTKEEKS